LNSPCAGRYQLSPIVDERVDLGGDEFLQDAAGFIVVGGESLF